MGAGGGQGQAGDGDVAGGEDGQRQQKLGGPGHVLDMNHNSDQLDDVTFDQHTLPFTLFITFTPYSYSTLVTLKIVFSP